MKLTLLFSLLFSVSLFAASPKVWVDLPSRHLAVNEIGQVNLYSLNIPLKDIPRFIDKNEFSLKMVKNTSITTQSGDTQFIYNYQLTTKTAGEFTIPSIEVTSHKGQFKTQPTSFQVHELSDFDMHTIELGDKDFTYYSKQFCSRKKTFVNESFRSEVRFLIPTKLRLSYWNQGSPKLDNNLVAWRYEPPEAHGRYHRYSLSTSSLIIDQSNYIGGSYYSMVHGLSAGAVEFGEFSAAVHIQVTQLTRFGHRITNERLDLTASPQKHEIISLPENPPSWFKGDVGVYTMHSSTPEKTSLRPSDSIKIQLTLSGEGDFTSLRAPSLVDNKHWKLLDVTKNQLEEERKNAQGSVTFSFLLSPLEGVTKTPNIVFPYFNPTTQSYENLYAKRVPITLLPEVEAKPKVSIFIPESGEQQNDILGFIDVTMTDRNTRISLPFSWHYIPASICAGVLLLWIYLTWQRRLGSMAPQLERKQQLKDLAKNSADTLSFYKAVGDYIQRWAPNTKEAEILKLLDKRDNHCYLPPNEQKSEALSLDEKKSVLKLLKLLPLVILICLFTPTQLEANLATDGFDTAIEKFDFQQAADLLEAQESHTADESYNLGNCYYRLGKPGMAALQYHRATLQQPNHREAQQNLQFLAALRKDSDEVYAAPDAFKQSIAKLPLQRYWFILQLSSWVLIFSLLVLFLLKPKRVCTVIFIILPISSLCLICLSFAAAKLYPKSIQFSPIQELAVITQPKYELKTEPLTHSTADTQSDTFIVELTETTLCKIIAKRASWSYIELPSQTRGWVKSEAVQAISSPKLKQY